MTPEEIMSKAIEANSKEIYSDTVSPAAKQVGKLAEDAAKVGRLLLFPIQYLAAWQNRYEKYCKRIADYVPTENLQEAPISFSGPILEKLKYLEEDNYLTTLYLNLLARAMDKDRIDEAHPAFLQIIEQLSPDEALILSAFKTAPRPELVTSFHFHYFPDGSQFGETVIERDDIPKVMFERNIKMYNEHLQSLNLITIDVERGDNIAPVDNPEYPNLAIRYVTKKLYLTAFGSLFIQAVVPEVEG